MKKNHTNFLLLTVVTAISGLGLGLVLQAGASSSGIKRNEALVAQAQPKATEPATPETRPTSTPSTAQKTQYRPESQTQQAQGIKFTVSHFHVENNHVYTNVCYDLPGKDVWDINRATLTYGAIATENFAVHETSIAVAKNSSAKGFRCITLDFYDIEANPNLSTLRLSINALGQISPLEGHECEEYAARIKLNNKVAKAGIETKCELSANSAQMKITKKSSSMSDEDAHSLVSQAMVGEVNGPWVFTVTKQ